MSNAFYTATGNPGFGSDGLSATMRAEFLLIQTAFDLVPQIGTTGLFKTTFNQSGSFTFNLPSAPGTLAMVSDIAVETARATAAEGTLTTAVSTNTAAISTEATARAAADSAEVTNRNTAIGVETTRAQTAEGTLSAAISTETTNRQNADTAEVTARNAAIAVETARATAAEGVLTTSASTNATAISTETTNRIAGDAAVAATVTTEANNRIAGDAAVSAVAGAAIGRNRLHNSSMEISQRGTSGTITGTAAYSLDRWMVSTSGTSGTWSKTSAGAGWSSRNNMVLTASLASGNTLVFQQRLEAARVVDLVGQTVTVQFNCNASTSAGATAFTVSLYNPAGADNFGSVNLIQSQTFTPTTSQATYTATFNALPSNAANGLMLQFVATQSGSTGTVVFQLTSVQLEAGSVATAYERRDPALDLLTCQRFYQVHTSIQVAGYGAASGPVYGDFSYSAPMRTPGGGVNAALGTVAYSNASALTIGNTLSTHVRLSMTATALGMATAVADLTISAEL